MTLGEYVLAVYNGLQRGMSRRLFKAKVDLQEPMCVPQCWSALQVLRVDYPLPNTGLMYKGTGVTRGEKWWNRPGSAVASPKQAVTLQQSHAVPPASKGSPPAQVRPTAARSGVLVTPADICPGDTVRCVWF